MVDTGGAQHHPVDTERLAETPKAEIAKAETPPTTPDLNLVTVTSVPYVLRIGRRAK